MIIGCSASVELARNIARRANDEFSPLLSEKFPDGETHLRFRTGIRGKDIALVQSLAHPNDKLIEILFAAHTARDLGARSVTLVAPYMAYLRQDKRFYPNECISARVTARLFRVFDRVITIDPHLHRIHRMSDLFRHSTRLSANSLIGEYIEEHFRDSLIIGPDEESCQWARKIAQHIKSHAVVLKKKRYNSRHVSIRIRGDVDLRTNVVIVDDIISTGHTMIETVKEAKKLGAKKIYCICVHGIFAEDALTRLRKAGAAGIISTNSIEGPTSKIDISPLIARSLCS
ncbi:MAG: ribose-phosphate diphosphokinase [archaeon]